MGLGAPVAQVLLLLAADALAAQAAVGLPCGAMSPAGLLGCCAAAAGDGGCSAGAWGAVMDHWAALAKPGLAAGLAARGSGGVPGTAGMGVGAAAQ
jgi:hypothetical protein